MNQDDKTPRDSHTGGDENSTEWLFTDIGTGEESGEAVDRAPESEAPEPVLADTQIWDTETSDPETSDPETVDSEPVDSEPVNRGTADPEPSDSETSDSETSDPAASDDDAETSEEDPFAGWPQAASAEVIEDEPGVEDDPVQHVAGEIEVPDGYTVLEGTPSGHRRSVAVVVSRFNGGLTNRMLHHAIAALEEAGVAQEAVTIVPVPGAFELPLTAMALAKTRRYACVVALGAIVRGETPHFDFVASEAASGLQLAAIETGVPVAFGVLTVDTVEQGEARIDRAGDAVRTALEMADVFARLRASAARTA